jgi:hypothetical protein
MAATAGTGDGQTFTVARKLGTVEGPEGYPAGGIGAVKGADVVQQGLAVLVEEPGHYLAAAPPLDFDAIPLVVPGLSG